MFWFFSKPPLVENRFAIASTLGQHPPHFPLLPNPRPSQTQTALQGSGFPNALALAVFFPPLLFSLFRKPSSFRVLKAELPAGERPFPPFFFSDDIMTEQVHPFSPCLFHWRSGPPAPPTRLGLIGFIHGSLPNCKLGTLSSLPPLSRACWLVVRVLCRALKKEGTSPRQN